VREHRARRIRLDAEGRDDARPTALDAVRADVRLLQRPDRRFVVADEDALVEPLAVPEAGEPLVRLERQVDDVVRVEGTELGDGRA
jgi:hypothetical protein